MATAETRRSGVFLSYSHADADRLARPKVYLENLRNRGVAQGWTDHQIKVGDDWNAEIQKALDAAGAAVLLISEDFLRSRFIRTVELPELLKARDERGLLLLPVNLYPSTVSEYPELAAIEALNGKTKFVCDMTKSEEEELWVRMSQEIKRAFSTPASAESPAPAPAEDDRPAIFLAPAATQFLSEFRDQVEDYLALQLPEVRILPHSSGQGGSRAAFVSAMRADIARSSIFVQLLDQSRGLDYFEDAPEEGVVALLHGCALELKTPRQILQWRDPDKKVPRAAEGTRAHLKLLEGPTVSIAGREEFKGLIVERYRELIAPEPRAPEGKTDELDVVNKQIFINAEPTRAWRAVAEGISKELTKKRKIPCVLLSDRLKTQADRREMRDYCFTHCDGLLFVGGSNPNWLPEEREAYQKLKAKRKGVGKTTSIPMALCEGPPKTGPCEGSAKDCFWCDPDALREASVSVNHRLPGFEVIDCSAGTCSDDYHCRGGVCTEAFERFVRRVRGDDADDAGPARRDRADAGRAQLEEGPGP